MNQSEKEQFEEDYMKRRPLSSQDFLAVFKTKGACDHLVYADTFTYFEFNMWLAGKERALKAYGINPDRKLPPPLPHADEQETPEQAWKFWKQFVLNEDGSVNVEALKNELSDFSMLLRFYSAMLGEVTGGAISKPNTHPSAVIAVFNDYLSLRCNEVAGEALDDAIKAVQALSGSQWVTIEAANEVVEELQAVKKAFT